MKKEHEFYLAVELAERLRVNIMTIYRYIKAGKLDKHAAKWRADYQAGKFTDL